MRSCAPLASMAGVDAKPPPIRPARSDELPLLIEIERAAGAMFRDLGMDAVAEDDPGSVEELAAFQREGRAFVYPNGHGCPAAYLLLSVIDGYGHVEQVSVHPSHSRRGIGKQLIEAADEWASGHALAGLALTTYAHVPWNAPYYRRLGFLALPEPDVPPGLRAVREHEAARGLDAWPRVVMVRALRSSHPGEDD
jgi:GNAT superfamily N-acetyltransferase